MPLLLGSDAGAAMGAEAGAATGVAGGGADVAGAGVFRSTSAEESAGPQLLAVIGWDNGLLCWDSQRYSKPSNVAVAGSPKRIVSPWLSAIWRFLIFVSAVLNTLHPLLEWS